MHMAVCPMHEKIGAKYTHRTDRQTALLESELICPAKVSETDIKQTGDLCASDQYCEAVGCLATAKGGDRDKGGIGKAWEQWWAGCLECASSNICLEGKWTLIL